MEMDSPVVAEPMADVAAAVSRRAAAVSKDVYQVILHAAAKAASSGRNVELALQATRWLGPSVLQPVCAARGG